MRKAKGECTHQCAMAVAAVSLVLKRATTASDNVHQDLLDDTAIIYHNAVQTVMNIDNYSLNMDYEKELFRLREELRSELRGLLEALTSEYLQHKNVLELLSKRLEDGRTHSNLQENMCAAEVSQAPPTLMSPLPGDLQPSPLSISQPDCQTVAAATDSIIKELMLQYSSSLPLDLDSLPSLFDTFVRLTSYHDTTRLELSQILQLLRYKVNNIDNLRLAFELLATNMDESPFRLKDLVQPDLLEGKDTDGTTSLGLALMYWLGELVLRLNELDNQIEIALTTDEVSRDMAIAKLTMELQVTQLDNTGTLSSKPVPWELEAKLECRRAELLVESHQQVSALLIKRNRYVQEITKMLKILMSLLRGKINKPDFPLDGSLLSDLVLLKLNLRKDEVEQQLLACSLSSSLLKKLTVLHIMHHHGYSSSLDIWSLPLEPCNGQLLEREYLSARSYVALAQSRNDHGDSDVLTKLIAELTEDLQTTKQVMDELSLDVNIPEAISNDYGQPIDCAHSLPRLDCIPDLDLIKNPLTLLHHEASIPKLVGFMRKSGTDTGSEAQINTLIDGLQALIASYIPFQELPLSSAEQYAAKKALGTLGNSVQSRFQLFKTIWSSLLEIADKRKGIMKNVGAALSICITEVSNTVADSSQRLASVVEDSLLLVIKLLLDLSSAELDRHEDVLSKLSDHLEEIETKLMEISCNVQFDSLGESFSIEPILDELIEEAKHKHDVVVKRDRLTVTWTKPTCLGGRYPSEIAPETLLDGHSAHYAAIRSAIEHCVIPKLVRLALLHILDTLTLQSNAAVPLAEDDLHISGLATGTPASHRATRVSASTKSTLGTHRTSSATPLASAMSATSSLVCKVAADVIAPDAHERGYISALQMSQYTKISGYAQSVAPSNGITSSMVKQKQSTAPLLASQVLHRLGIGGQAKQPSALSKKCSKEVGNLVKHGAIYYFDENYKSLHVIKALAGLQRSEVQMLEYIFGYMKHPHQVLYWTGKNKHPHSCTIHISVDLQDLVILHCERVMHSISSRAIMAVTDNPLKTHHTDLMTRLFPLVLSTSGGGDLMVLFNGEREAVVFKVGLQTLIRHRNSLSRLATVSRCE